VAVVLTAAAMPVQVPTAPRARLNLPVPVVRSVITNTVITVTMAPTIPSHVWASIKKRWALADTQKRTPDWLQSEADQQDRLATPLLSIMTDPRPCDSDDKLRHNYGGCHKNRADALLPAAKILADQRKH